MSQPQAKSAKSVQEALTIAGLNTQVLELPNSTRTAIDAANSIGCDVCQIVKSLIFKTKTTKKPVLILASGPTRVNEKKIERQLGEAITKADADFAKLITGFAIGGIPPIGHKSNIEFIFIDQDLMALNEVWAAAGTPNAVFCIKSTDLLKLTGATVISISNKD